MSVEISPKVTGPVPEHKHSLSLSLSQKDHKSNKNATNGQDKEKAAQSKLTKKEDTASSTQSKEKEDSSKIGKNKNENSKSSQKSSENGNANDQDKKVSSGKDDGKNEPKTNAEKKVKNDNSKTTESPKSEAVPKTEKEKTKVEPAPKTDKDKAKAESAPKLDKEKNKNESTTKTETTNNEAAQKSEKVKNETPQKSEKVKNETPQKSEKAKIEPKNNTTERKTRKNESQNDSEATKARRPSQSKMDITTEKEIVSTKTDKKDATKAKAADKQEADIKSSDTVSDPSALNGNEGKAEEKGEVQAANHEPVTPTADEEMAPLSVDSEHEINEKLSAGKILKLKSTPISQKFTTSEKSKVTEKISRKVLPDSPLSSSTIRSEQLRSPIPSSLRQISGRRSFRNLADMPTRKHNYETYRPCSMELDNTSSSLNVTIGSEVAADSSFTFFGFGRKREHTESVDTQSTQSSSEVDNASKTPKRARLDTSGIMNIVKTPITLLRSRFARVGMRSSTPNIDSQKHDDDGDEDGVENVSIADAEEALNHLAASKDEPSIVEELELKELQDDNEESSPAEESLKEETLKMDVGEGNVEDTAAETGSGDKKRGCNIM